MGLQGARLRGIVVAVHFAPEVSLDPDSQKELQRAGEERGIEINYVRRGVEESELGRRHPNSRELLRVHAKVNVLTVDERFPRASETVVVEEIDEVLKAAIEVFNPSLLPVLSVRIRKQAAAPGGDARVFLGDRVLRFSERRKAAFGRPIHTVGLSFFMPPYDLGDQGETSPRESNAMEVRIESLNENVADLYLECACHFFEPMDPSEFATVRPRVEATERFLDERVVAFLEQGE